MSVGRALTDAERRSAVAMYRAGEPYRAIAKRFRVGWRRMRDIMREEGVDLRPKGRPEGSGYPPSKDGLPWPRPDGDLALWNSYRAVAVGLGQAPPP